MLSVLLISGVWFILFMFTMIVLSSSVDLAVEFGRSDNVSASEFSVMNRLLKYLFCTWLLVWVF